MTYVVVAAWEWLAVSTTSGQIDLGLMLPLVVDNKRRVQHRNQRNAEVRALTVDGDVRQEHGQRYQPATTLYTQPRTGWCKKTLEIPGLRRSSTETVS